MFTPYERMISLRYLRAKRKEGFISVISGFSLAGIALGVATLIIVMSVMNGFRDELLGRILGLNGHLSVIGREATISNYDAIVSRIVPIKNVTTAFPTIEAQALVTTKSQAFGVMVRGMRPMDFAMKPVLSQHIVNGKGNDLQDGQIAVGARLAQKLNLHRGDALTLLSPRGNETPFGVMPRSRVYTIGLVFDVGMFEYDSNFVFMTLDDAQRFFDLPGQANTIEIYTSNPNIIRPIQAEVRTKIPETAIVTTWQQSNGSYFNALQTERNVMFLILTLIILVAAFNVISGMIMLVKDKSRDIAILRTMGATRGAILRIFFMTGASIGFIGTALGLLGGILFAENIERIRQFLQGLTGTDLFSAEIYFLSKLPAVVDYKEVLVIGGMALTLSFLATLYPAWRAARLDPVEALRYE